jgi:transketolase
MALSKAKQSCYRPTALILDTIKGKGCSFAEQMEDNHNISVSREQAAAAVKVLNDEIHKLEDERGNCHEN